MNQELDVIIIGAGAAGLAAGLRLRQIGLRYLVLEAQDRRGGRAWTDHQVFGGIPLDRGCHWLHDAKNNPLRQVADELGYGYDSDYNFHKGAYWLGGKRAGPAEQEAFRKAVDEGYGLVAAAGKAGRDIAPSEVLDREAPWAPFVDHLIGLDAAATLDSVSAIDLVRGVQLGDDYPVEKGFGALLEEHTREVEVALSTPVSAIDWSGKRIKVTTDKGELTAGALVITVSTSLLASGGIRFTPGLPSGLEAAIADTPLGCAEKVCFLLDRPLEDFAAGYTIGLDDLAAEPRQPLSYYLNLFGEPVVVTHLGGAYSFDLAEAGEAAMIDLCRQGLVDIVGSDVRKRIRKETATGWWRDPWIQGAYSASKPGRAASRLKLAEPIEGRIFLAGEAVSQDAYATCHGAYITGLDAADKAGERIRKNAA